jgi:hypothetical protein
MVLLEGTTVGKRIPGKAHHRFGDLYRWLNQDVLRLCFFRLRKDAASGVDGVTYQEYECAGGVGQPASLPRQQEEVALENRARNLEISHMTFFEVERFVFIRGSKKHHDWKAPTRWAQPVLSSPGN